MPGQPTTAGALAPRRLSREERRRQLVAAAVPLAARQGLSELSLDDLASRAGVTRNLVYHYFPRGRPDVALAVVEEAERQLWRPQAAIDADSAPTGGAESANLVTRQPIAAAMLDHALAPTHAWRIHRMATATADLEVRATVARFATDRVEALRSTQRGNADRGAVADVALHGYLAFAEAALDRGRATRVPRPELVGLLEGMLAAALEAAER